MSINPKSVQFHQCRKGKLSEKRRLTWKWVTAPT